MTGKRKRHRPADPMEIARRRAAERLAEREPERWGVDTAAFSLPANADVQILATTGPETRARRRDVFDLFHARGALSAAGREAVRRLREDVAVLHRTEAGGRDMAPKIDTTRRSDGFSDRRLAAGERIEAALRLAGPASAALIAALAEADVVTGRSADWRAIVARQTGETLADAQGAVLRAACENLAGAYVALDNERVRRRASA